MGVNPAKSILRLFYRLRMMNLGLNYFMLWNWQKICLIVHVGL